MVALEQLIIPLLSFISFMIFFHKWRSGNVTRKNVPPSPRKLPIIGNLHQLGTSPHRSLQSLSMKHGPLLLLHFGNVPVLIASSAEAASEIMKTHDVIFSNRPKLSFPDRLSYGSKDVAFAPYGESWRQNQMRSVIINCLRRSANSVGLFYGQIHITRTICVLHLLSTKRVQSFRRVREEETSAMVEKIRQLGTSLQVVNLSDVWMSVTNNIVCRAALGRKYADQGEDKKFKMLLSEFGELVGATSLRDYIPWLGWIDRVNGLDAKADRVAKKFDEFWKIVLQEHRDGNKRDCGDGGFDFVDILLESQRESKGSNCPVEDDSIKAVIMDMFGAGSDTTSTSLEWAIAELIKNPRTMKVLQNEVRQVAGNKKEIDEDDIEKMSYLKAVIKESLRLHSPVPLLIPRECTQDTKVMGYDVSVGTQVLINAWAIGRDPALWENPEEFRPERFLESNIDFRGLHFELIPFGAGRRGCPGISFGVAVNELALAKLVHSFNFALPNGERNEDLDMSETCGITVHKKLPMLVVTTSFSNDIAN